MDDDIKYPICPLNMYYEGDENTCNEEGCDYDLSTRSCFSGCIIKKDEDETKTNGN